jgi:hypothetical protein
MNRSGMGATPAVLAGKLGTHVAGRFSGVKP